MTVYTRPFAELGMDDVGTVGGKNASLGEMVRNLASLGIRVPDGFATTADAFREHLARSGLDARVAERLEGLDSEDVTALAAAGGDIRRMIVEAPLSDAFREAIATGWRALVGDAEPGTVSVAVRSSATAEDLPEASFAGQQETFLNVTSLEDVLDKVREVFASLYNDRAISYRVHQGFAHADVALSAGIQRMVRSDVGASGVMFSVDTETGFADAVFVTSSWGLGECVVQGSVNPDEFYVHKPTLAADRPAILRRTRGSKAIKMVYGGDGAGSDHAVATVDTDDAERLSFSLEDADVESLARMAVTIERHYGRPMDIEWGKDGHDGALYILQARPETVESRTESNVIRRYRLDEHEGAVLVRGRSIGQRIGAGIVRVIEGIEGIDRVREGDVLVTDMTDPDWEPVMKRAAAIVTNRGGRTCHAAIIARELGVPAIVGCGDATARLSDGQAVTASCAEGDTGFVYAGELPFAVAETRLDTLPELPFKLTMNVGNPERAFGFSRLPHAGVGLARLEFIISNTIGVHPKALLEHDAMPDDVKRRDRRAGRRLPEPGRLLRRQDRRGRRDARRGVRPAPGHRPPERLQVERVRQHGRRLAVRARRGEPDDRVPRRLALPLLLVRGMLRARVPRAETRARGDGADLNVELMVPFVRTLEEADQVLALMESHGLVRGENGLRVVMMCEVPSNAVLAEEFLERFDGFSIGSNDLTQLTLGLDRDSGLVAHLFDERDPAVMKLLGQAIAAARKAGKYVGICGQGPSDHPDLARWLMEQGISSVSLNPDTLVETWLFLAGENPAP